MKKKKNRLYSLKKKMMTLVEILVATSILSILLVFLFGYFQHMIKLNEEAKILREESFQIRYTQFRLATAIPYASLRNGNNERILNKKDELFFTSDVSNDGLEPGSLLFVYHRGTEYAQGFSEEVLARLYLDNHQQLCLGLWKLPSKWKERVPEMKREILMNHVTSLSFKFYVPPDHKKTVDPEKVTTGEQKVDPKSDEWHPYWKRNYSGLPAMVQVIIKRKLPNKDEEEIVFMYALLYTTRRIEYP